MLNIETGSIQTRDSYRSHPGRAGGSPAYTPASTSTTESDLLSTPATALTSSTFAEAIVNARSSRQNSTILQTLSEHKDKKSRLSAISNLPKRVLSQKNAVSQRKATPLSLATAFSRPAQKFKMQILAHTIPKSKRAHAGKGHKYSKSDLSDTSAPASIQTYAHSITPGAIMPAMGIRQGEQTRKAQRPLTYQHRQHHETVKNPTPNLHSPRSEFQPGLHPGQPYNPHSAHSSPSASPQSKSATDCWEEDPPYVRRRLQKRHWEVLFGDFNWAAATARRGVKGGGGASCSPGRRGTGDSAGRKELNMEWGGVSPRSRSPVGIVGDEKESFSMIEEEQDQPLRRGRPRLRAPTRDGDAAASNGAGGGGFGPSADVLQARELAEKLARVRMKT